MVHSKNTLTHTDTQIQYFFKLYLPMKKKCSQRKPQAGYGCMKSPRDGSLNDVNDIFFDDISLSSSASNSVIYHTLFAERLLLLLDQVFSSILI